MRKISDQTSEIMYKRPILRPRQEPVSTNKKNIKPGHHLYNIVNPVKVPEVTRRSWTQPIYMKDVYLELLNKSLVSAGLEPIYPDIPDSEDTVREFPVPEIVEGDPEKVRVVLKCLKSGIIRVKLDTLFRENFIKVSSTQTPQSITSWVQACKNIGMSGEFIDTMVTKHKKRIEHGKKVASKMEAIFEGLGAAKTKKKKEKKEKEKEKETKDEDDILTEDVENLEENLPKEDDANEDEGMDMEVDEDENDDGETQEEEYYSDAE